MIDINWKPNKESEEPLYRQIVKFISEKVRSGDWVVGSKLPSQRALAEMFSVNRSTIVTAMQELISYGILESDYGSGTRVCSNTWSLLMSNPPDWNRYIMGGPFRANIPTIQTINKLEFEEGYIRIGTGELSPDLYPRKLMTKLIKKAASRISSLNYLGPLGLPELQEALAFRLSEKLNIEARRENIFISSGSIQALQLISVCMLKKGSLVYTESPTYLKSLQIFQSAGMEMRGIPMDEEGIKYWDIREKDRTSLLYTIPTHHNPTGRVMSEKRREELLKFSNRMGLPIIEDDAYRHLWLEKEPPKTLKSMDESGSVLYMGTISKTLAPGLRLGWVVGPEAVVQRLGDVKMQTDYGASSMSQWILFELLSSNEYDTYLHNLRENLRARRENLVRCLEKNFVHLATWEKPTGGFYIWLTFKEKMPMDKIFDECLKRGVLLNPGNVYDYKENNAIRLSYAYASMEEMEKALEILADVIINIK